jgi:hypothetical protein
MISNLGKFAHPKRKASGMAKRPVGLASVIGNQGSFPAPPKSKPDPINRNVNDVSMTGAVPGRGGMPKGSIPSNNLATQGANPGTATLPPKKPGNKKTGIARTKKATVPFFGGY